MRQLVGGIVIELLFEAGGVKLLVMSLFLWDH
jgi:hypothetical protein